MSEQPEITTLAQRMDYAATVLEEANARYNLPSDASWKASSLRREAYVVADEDKETAEREALVTELGAAIYDALHDTGFAYKDTARALIQNGWTKP